jgi:hypothetical protein
MTMTVPKLAIIAGTGDLPVRVIDACRRQGRPFFVLAFTGQTPPETVVDTPHEWVRLGAAGQALKLLRREQIEQLVLAGQIERPSLSELKPDLWVTLFLARVGMQIFDNDDGILGALVRELEEKEGFSVVDAEFLLAESTVSI